MDRPGSGSLARLGRAASVAHEHVVAIHAVDSWKGLPYLVMQYVPGTSLQGRIESDGPLAVVAILRIGMQVASGLAAAHAQGLVHRDIKPANILLENGIERVKITDFGLARAADDASLTQSGVAAGTPNYMAPEQARCECIDPRADLFSLGGVMYAMCTGRPPFRAGTAIAVLQRVCEDTARPIRADRPEIPAWLEQIVFKLLAKDPGARFQTAREVAELFGRCLVCLEQPAGAPPFPCEPDRKPFRGVGKRGTAAALVVLMLIAGLGAFEVGGLSRISGFLARFPRINLTAFMFGGDASPEEITVDFTRRSYDRWLFRPEAGPDGGRWDTASGGLHAAIPTGTPDRGPLRFQALMRLEGDFEVTTDFTLLKLNRPAAPTPQSKINDPSNNVEIFLNAAERVVTVFRDSQPSGEGWGFYANSPEGGVTWRRFPGSGPGKNIGGLAVRRTGDSLTFLRSEMGGPLVEMGTASFCAAPITGFGLQALALRSPDAIDVRFDRLSIKADKLVKYASPTTTDWNAGLWLTIAVVAAAAVAGVIVWRVWAGRGEAAKAETNEHVRYEIDPQASRSEPTTWVHSHRDPGRDRRHCHSDRALVAGRPSRARGGAAGPVLEQLERDRPGARKLRSRRSASTPSE